MDQKLNTMVNGNLLCKDLTNLEEVTSTGFSVKKETKFKTLLVELSSCDDVSKGDVIVVPYHSGKEIDNKVIVNKQYIIYIK